MKRRDFMTVACATGIAGAALGTVQAQTEAGNVPSGREFIELRQYEVADQDKKAKWLDILDKAHIPAINRLGIKTVGVFYTNPEINDGNKNGELSVWVVIPHKTMDSIVSIDSKLLADKQFMKDAEAVFSAPVKDPIFKTYKSALMLGFDKCPGVEVPNLSEDRILQIRYYRSYNIERNAAKVNMFDEGGELPLFRKKGMDPVFFGTTIFGDMMPNLTYMLSFKNLDAKAAAWKAFVESPEWGVISKDPKYKDTATEIFNVMLKPTKGSQI